MSMQGELQTVAAEASSSINTLRNQLLGDFAPDSPLSDSQAGAVALDLLQLFMAVGGPAGLAGIQF